MPVLLTKKYECESDSVEEEVRRLIGEGRPGSFLYVVPTKRKVRELQREFLGLVPEGAAASFHVFTVETLAASLFRALCPPKRLLSRPMQAVLLLEAIKSVESSLSYVRLQGARKSLPRGTLKKIIDVIDHLKESGVYLSLLEEEVQHAGAGERPRLEDILAIARAYESVLGDRFIDAAGILKDVNLAWQVPRAHEVFKRLFPACDRLLVSGFDEFSDPELTFLHHLSNCPGVGAAVSFDYERSNEHVFGHLGENYQKFLDMGFTQRNVRPAGDGSLRAVLASNLFRAARDWEPADCSDRITVVRAHDREREVEAIAKLVKEFVDGNPGQDLSRICVAMHQPQLYTPLFREIFPSFGIPANITDRYRLDQAPPVLAILSLFLVQERDYRAGDLVRALSGACFRHPPSGEPFDPGTINSVASILRITGGRDTWKRRIEHRLEAIREELAAAGDDDDGYRLAKESAMLVRAQRDLQRVERLLSPFASDMTPAGFRSRVVDLIDAIGLVEAFMRGRNAVPEQVELDARAFQKFMAFLDEFLFLLSLEGKGEDSMPLSFYAERLRQTIAEVRYNVRQRYGAGIFVTSLDETRGLNFDVMVIAGLVEGEFPPPYQPEVFFSAERRERRERYHLREHRYLFYQAAANCTRHLFLTVPQFDGDTPLVPSSFVGALAEVVRPADAGLGLAARLDSVICSQAEYLRAAALNRPGLPPVRELGETLGYMRLAIDAEQRRIDGEPLPQFDGTVAAPENEQQLAKFRDRVYSATQLEKFGVCPFQFFADRVLRLQIRPEVEEEMTPLERGSLIHGILYDFYMERREKGLPPPSKLDDEGFREAVDRLCAIGTGALERLATGDIFPDIEREQLTGTPERKGILREFLELERERSTELTPAYFEASFGSETATGRRSDPLLTHPDPVVIQDVKLRGRIDRIDVGEGLFAVVDYKTGSSGSFSFSDLEIGTSLQLPLYLAAVEQILVTPGQGPLKAVSGSHYYLKSPVKERVALGNGEFRETLFPKKRAGGAWAADEETFRSAIARAVAFVNEYVDTMAQGRFSVNPKDPAKACRSCDFRTVCRIRVRKETGGRLEEEPS